MHAVDSRYSGAMTAIVTPFLEDGEVDHEALAALARWQVEEGINERRARSTAAPRPGDRRGTIDPVPGPSLPVCDQKDPRLADLVPSKDALHR